MGKHRSCLLEWPLGSLGQAIENRLFCTKGHPSVIICSSILLFSLPFLSGNRGKRWHYSTLRRQFCWPNIANDAYTTVSECQSCARQRTRNRHRKELRLTPAAGRVEFVVVYILGPLIMMKSGYQHIIVLTDRYINLIRAILDTTVTLTSTAAATIFVDSWVTPYRTLTNLLTFNRL